MKTTGTQIEKTLHLIGVAGMRESLLEGLNTAPKDLLSKRKFKINRRARLQRSFSNIESSLVFYINDTRRRVFSKLPCPNRTVPNPTKMIFKVTIEVILNLSEKSLAFLFSFVLVSFQQKFYQATTDDKLGTYGIQGKCRPKLFYRKRYIGELSFRLLGKTVEIRVEKVLSRAVQNQLFG